MDKVKRTFSSTGDVALAEARAEFERGRAAPVLEDVQLPPAEGVRLPPEVMEEVRKYRQLTHETFTRGWRGKLHQWLGISAVLKQFANGANQLFATEISERRRLETQVDELTGLCNFLATEVAKLKKPQT